MSNLDKILAQSSKSTSVVTPSLWRPSTISFGPGSPIFPTTPQEPPRREQYEVSRNINWTPRAEEHRAVTYGQMRSLSRLSGVLRTVIEKRKDEIKGLDFEISMRPEFENSVADPAQEVKDVETFFEKPDLETPFDQWENALLEDIYVIDAPALYKERDRLGRFRSLQTIDGSTIKVLVNDAGRVPQPPQLAYEQVIYGMPHTGYVKPMKGMNPFITPQSVLFTDYGREIFSNYEEMYYRPYNISSDGVYGSSHVESIIMTVQISLNRDISMREWFRSGNVPAGFIPVPPTWSPDQITQFENDFNVALAGDLAARSRLVAFPGVGTVQTISPLTFDSVFDQWLARIICARFNVSPIPYVSQINRSVGEEMEEASRDEGLVPMMQYLAAWYNDIIDNCLGKPYIQFKWNPGQNYDKDDSAMDIAAMEHGLATIDDLRIKQGKKPLPNGLGETFLILNGGSWAKVEDVINGTANQPQGAQNPFGGLDPTQTSPEDFQISLAEDDARQIKRAELDDWQKFALNRIGKKTARTFQPKVLGKIEAGYIQSLLSVAESPEEIKAVFEVAKQNLNRPKDDDFGIVEMEDEYKKHLLAVMQKHLKFNEADHPRAPEGNIKKAEKKGAEKSKLSDEDKMVEAREFLRQARLKANE
jgi:hypothetical protein